MRVLVKASDMVKSMDKIRAREASGACVNGELKDVVSVTKKKAMIADFVADAGST
jgi:hypothetical protein